MAKFRHNILQVILISLTISQIFRASHGDVGTTAQYSPPYLPTQCYGADSSEFPTSNLFAAAGEGIWDNGASCGRQYQVRCISAAKPRTCVPEKIILIKIVDYAGSLVSSPSAPGTTMILSQTAFAVIANSTATTVNIEFQQFCEYVYGENIYCFSMTKDKKKSFFLGGIN